MLGADFRGFFDRFKKQSSIPQVSKKTLEEQKHYETKIESIRDGRLQVDFYDKEAGFRQLYDNTRLIVRREPINIAGQMVYECAVLWYNL